MCRSRCVLRVNVAGHIEQDFGRGGSVGVDVDVDGLLGPADMSFSKIPGIIIFYGVVLCGEGEGKNFMGPGMMELPFIALGFHRIRRDKTIGFLVDRDKSVSGTVTWHCHLRQVQLTTATLNSASWQKHRGPIYGLAAGSNVNLGIIRAVPG